MHQASGLDMAASELGEYAGWLLKGAPKLDDEDKEVSVVRKLKRAANVLLSVLQKHGDFKRRFFVLDGNELRYYRDDTLSKQSGIIDLGTVLDVRYTDDPRVPAFAFQLVRTATWILALSCRIQCTAKPPPR